MWAIKFLSGPKAGQEVLLQKGMVIVGRDESCQIVVSSKNISKRHAQITVSDKGLEIEDLDSSNGIFYNSKKIRMQKLVSGDRVALHDIIFEVVYKPTQQIHPYFQSYTGHEQSPNQKSEYANDPSENSDKLDVQNIEKGIKSYLHNIVLPGIYKLAEWLEFKWVVGFFMIGFIFLVTILSSVPLVQILKSSVEQESKNHAESIAVTIAKLNRSNLKTGLHAALDVSYAQKRPGVDRAYIISALDGRILAPAELAHTYPKESFIHQARKQEHNSIEKVGVSKVGAVVPIKFYNTKTESTSPLAYAVVMYDMGAISVGGTKIFSLLVQNLFIACLLGLIAFFFLINLIEFPIRSINNQLNKALKDNQSSHISTSYESSLLNELCEHINTALNKISINQMLNNQNENSDNLVEINRQNEMNNVVEVVGFPCLSIDLKNETIASLNSNFVEQMGYEEILHQPLQSIDHQDLKNHLVSLIEQGQANPEDISFGEINLKNMKVQTTCQFIMGQNEPAFAIITFMSAEEGAA